MSDETERLDDLGSEQEARDSMSRKHSGIYLRFNVVGTSFRKDQLEIVHKHYLQRKKEGKPTDIILVPEPTNPYDKHAIKVCMFLPPDHIFFGYIQRHKTLTVQDWQSHYPHHTIRIAYMGDNHTGTGNIGCIVELKETE